MANLTLAVTGASATGQVASLGAPGLLALTLPKPQLSVSGVGAVPGVQFTLPTPLISVSGLIGASGALALSVPVPVLALLGPNVVHLSMPVPVFAARALAGVVGSVGLVLPVPVLSLSGPNTLALALPGWNAPAALALGGSAGVVGGVVFNLRAPALSLVGQVPYTGQLGLVLPAPRLVMAGGAGVTGSVATTLRGLALAIQGHSGVLGRVVLTLPVSVFGASGYENTSGQVQLVLPHLQLVATGLQSAAAPASTASNTLAMHTEALGLTTYSNFPFNSFATFNGLYLAASPAGLFTLGGATDNGAIIQAAARVGITDFGTSHLKRVDRVYVGYRTDGNLVLRIFTDEVNQRDYRLTATGKLGLHGNHARLGKGLAARYWQFEVLNEHGADFELNMIELKPTKLRRRVGGGDA